MIIFTVAILTMAIFTMAILTIPMLQADFYHGFCRGYLRPIFHNLLRVPDHSDPFVDAEWRALPPHTRDPTPTTT